ncbi:MAG: ABC transporter permease [Planctomycetota bacterium]|jgi:branched-chain amino acid transport system permease protein|nr:ABC transporter permease [Planctomycetota bacterium]
MYGWLEKHFNGPQTLGESRFFWTSFLLGCLFILCVPLLADEYDVGNYTYFLLHAFLALGLSLIWGQGNILSFGQMAFFGIGGYSYGIFSVNLLKITQNTFFSMVAAIAFASCFAAFLGYFLFYGRVSGVYVTIITMVSTMILETFMAQTAGPQWTIGLAPLGGYNGMTNIPPLQLNLGREFPCEFRDARLYYFVATLAIAVYMGLRKLANSRHGNALIAVGSNPLRSEMLGYDGRMIQFAAFTIAGALAAVSGALYAAWGNYINPSVMGLTSAAMPVVWVAFGGRRCLLGCVVSALSLQYFSQYLSVEGSQYALVIQGGVLMLAIMFVPEGVTPPLGRLLGAFAAGVFRSRAGRRVPIERLENHRA